MDVVALRQRLDALDHRLEKEIGGLLQHVAEDSVKELDSGLDSDKDVTLDEELLNQIQALHSGIKSAESDFEARNYASCIQNLESQSVNVSNLDISYPNSLLAVDITRRIRELKEKALRASADLWSKSVQLENQSFRVSADSKEQATAIIEACPQLTNSLVKTIGSKVIEPLIQQNMEISLVPAEAHKTGYAVELNWAAAPTPSLALLFSNLNALVTFTASLPAPLSEMIPHRWGPHVVHELVNNTIPMLYPDSSTATEFRNELNQLEQVEQRFKSNGWTHSNELSQFASSFDLRWPEVRRDVYLTKLRRLYQDATPLTASSRQALVGSELEDEEEPQAVDEETIDETKDEWDWDGDDDDDDDGHDEGASEDAKEAAAAGAAVSGSDELDNAKHSGEGVETGSAVELWRQYYAELGSKEPEPFFVLFRALADSAYGDNYLWIYADTRSFIKHLRRSENSVDLSQLEDYANRQLHRYAVANVDRFDLELLPLVFSRNSSKALSQIKLEVDRIAVDTNDAGGVELREFVLSRIVEQICVFIIRTVLQMRDIGDNESMAYAATISKLESLAVYFADVIASVPSWTKMERLKDILSGNLTSIRDLHDQGMLADFGPEELSALIQALFVESSQRQRTIREVCAQR